MSAIACYTNGCTNSVIGQCPGYRESCGRFYCATHSSDKLCAECAARKLADNARKNEEAELKRLYQQYQNAASQIYAEEDLMAKQSRAYEKVVGLLVFGGILFAGLAANWASNNFQPYTTRNNIDAGEWFVISLGILMVVAGFVVGIAGDIAKGKATKKIESFVSSEIANYQRDLPEFTKFYHDWKKVRQLAENDAAYESLKLLVKGALVVSGAAVLEHRDSQLRSDVHALAKSARKINDKL